MIVPRVFQSHVLGPIGLAAALIAGSPVHALDANNFRLNSTGDLVALCSADPSAHDYVAAIHFCHGFAAGAYQYYSILAGAVPEARYVCVPDPPPSRSEAIAGFVDWAKRNPRYTSDKAVDSMFRYLSERYPCTPATARR